MTYVVLKGYLSNPMIDCVKTAVATEPGKGKYTEKTALFYSIFYSIRLVFDSIRLVLVSDPGLVSPLFRDELLVPVLHLVSGDRGEGGLSGKRGVP